MESERVSIIQNSFTDSDLPSNNYDKNSAFASILQVPVEEEVRRIINRRKRLSESSHNESSDPACVIHQVQTNENSSVNKAEFLALSRDLQFTIKPMVTSFGATHKLQKCQEFGYRPYCATCRPVGAWQQIGSRIGIREPIGVPILTSMLCFRKRRRPADLW
ncbi:uncharacterized protein LOC114939134 [Nylanderia fulva]|uniref:uncharacterized protein LOC114939134 n=1 Tax=Nylanderia fulva TaxID=613905 RepID=UPI0010FBA62F|nr:uncharacterized protein LOC114939134 [Nylanderia fulva]